PTSSPSPQTTPSSAKNAISAPIPGLITKLLCEVGKSYAQNDTLVIIEAMKMETELKAPKNLTVKKILVNAGDNVTQGASIIEFDESSS
ncbi:MAG: acetyl-CoA carboxylase biotin carboxyl carrier protein subunit, partial [Bradymonadales bacterium]